MTEAHITIEDIQSNVPGKIAKRVIVSGQLDESNVDDKAKEIYALIDANPQNLYVVFDFEGLEYMNSKSIGYLTDWYGKIFEAGGKVYIVKARENILDILQVVGLTQLIQCFGSMEELQPVLMNDLQGGAAPAQAATPSVPAAAPAPMPPQAAPQIQEPAPAQPAAQPPVEPTQPEVSNEPPAAPQQ